MAAPLIQQARRLEAPDATLLYWPGFLDPAEADALFETLYHGLAWEQQQIRLFGRTLDCPRLQAWYGDPGTHYHYSGLDLSPLPWPDPLDHLRRRLERACDAPFNAVLANLYRDGRDSMGWHSDNEPELGSNPTLASVSLGASRRFHLQHKKHRQQKLKLVLEPGSLLLMAGTTQQCWRHALPKQPAIHSARINLTFRRIQHPAGE